MLVQTPVSVPPLVMVLVFVMWAVISCIAIVLIKKRVSTRKKSLILLLVSMIVGGFVLGATPNPVLPINQILVAASSSEFNIGLVPMIIILAALLASTFIVGRAFCGYACPLGSFQEILSKFKYKSTVKEQSSVKHAVNLSSRISRIVRVIFFMLFVLITLAWNIAIIQLVNPFVGFRVFQTPAFVAIAIPVVILVAVAIASYFSYRPWCRLACPFGMIASFTSRWSRYKLQRTKDCTDCKLCEKVCPVGEASAESNKMECYLCNRCVDVCPNDALSFMKR